MNRALVFALFGLFVIVADAASPIMRLQDTGGAENFNSYNPTEGLVDDTNDANALANKEGKGNDDDDSDDAQCANDKIVADQFRAQQARSLKSVNALKALYNTSVLGVCQQYVNALAHSDAHLEELLSPLVTPTAKGRIHPLGFFNGSAALVEYFMLACNGGAAVLKLNFRHIQAVNDLVFFDVDFWFGTAANPTVYLRNLTHVGWARVNDNGQICALKANFQRLEINDRVLPPLANYDTVKAAHNASIYSSCTTIQSRCTGPNQQYATMGDCVAYLSSINGGGYTQGDQQSLQCVDLHTILTQIRPDVHCAHVGPTGGGKCVPHPQPGFYVQDEDLHC